MGGGGNNAGGGGGAGNNQAAVVVNDDDGVYEEVLDFTDYEPTAVDPGVWVPIGTVLICIAVALAAVVFLLLKTRRRRKKAKKKLLQEEKEDDETEVLGETFETYFLRRSASRVGNRLKGWTTLTNKMENKSEQAKKPTRASGGVADVLGRDLFDEGGVVHHINIAWAYNSSLNEAEEKPTVKGASETKKDSDASPSDKAPASDSESPEADKVATTDYNLMEEEEADASKPKQKQKRQPRKKLPSSWEYLRSLFQKDRETRKLLKLAIPYSISTMIDCVFSFLMLVIIGHMLGTSDLSAYIMVYYMFELSTMFLDGIISSITPVCSQAVGAEQYEVAGQYVQMSIVLSELLFLPQIYLWWNYADWVVLYFEFDEITADSAQSYARVFVFSCIIDLASHAFFNLLDVCGYEKFSAGTDILHGTVSLATAVAVAAHYRGHHMALTLVGVAGLVVDTVFFVGVVIYVYAKGWLDDYLPGLTGRFALWQGVGLKFFLQTAVPLSIGHVLSESEWEILFLMAGTLGPAEVAAWGIIGEIWSSMESITLAWGDAAEVRCAILLASGNTDTAQSSAYKSLIMGSTGAFVASGLLMLGLPFVPSWITTDETLQDMVRKELPLVALGNIALAIGSISWQLLGAQGRYSISTAVQFVGSWVITLPLALLSSVYLGWDLTGMVAAVVIGCMISGIFNFVILCCTKWERQGKKIMARLEKSGEKLSNEEDTDDSSSESSSDDEDEESNVSSVSDITDGGEQALELGMEEGMETTIQEFPMAELETSESLSSLSKNNSTKALSKKNSSKSALSKDEAAVEKAPSSPKNVVKKSSKKPESLHIGGWFQGMFNHAKSPKGKKKKAVKKGLQKHGLKNANSTAL